MQAADVGITVGETYDVECDAATPTVLTFEALLPEGKVRVTQMLVFVPASPT